MTFSLLDTVVLGEDLPTHGLLAGDIGAVVEFHGLDGVEVEFVTGAGRTQALVSLRVAQVRRMSVDEILSVRKIGTTRARARRTLTGASIGGADT